MPSLTYLGNVINYRNPGTLSRRLKITLAQANELIADEDKTKYIYNVMGDLQRFKLSDNPLFFQDFGIRRKSNKKLIPGARYKIKNNIIIDELPSDALVKLRITLVIKVWMSQMDGERRTVTENLTITPEHLEEEIETLADGYVTEIDESAIYEIQSVVIHSVFSNQLMSLTDGRLRDVKPLKLFYEDIDTTKYKDCVKDHLKKIYKKISVKTINKLGNKDGVSTEEIYTFCKKFKILMMAYDVNGNVIKKNLPEKKNKSYKNLIYIAHNNHLYPLKNKYLHSMKKNSDTIKLVDDADVELKKFLSKNIEPINVSTMFKDDEKKFIKCFDVWEPGTNAPVLTTYLENPEYNRCYKILKSFGIEDRINKHTTLKNVADLIMPLYNTKDGKTVNIDSFMPQHSQFIKGGYGYNKTKNIDFENVKTIDKNKCYSSCLAKLPYLIQLDIRQSKITKFTKDNQPSITPHYLYIAYVEKSSILIPNNNVYSGAHLKFAKQNGCKFMIKEEITTNKKFNYFKPMIDDVYKKCNNTDAKWLMNVFIGKFERDAEINKKCVVDRLCNEEESKTVSGYKRNIDGTNYYIIEKETETYNLFTQKPISIQIKDYSRRMINSKIKELGI